MSGNGIKSAVPAAYYGRVAFLFVAVGVQQWGAFDRGTNAVHVHQEAKPGDELDDKGRKQAAFL